MKYPLIKTLAVASFYLLIGNCSGPIGNGTDLHKIFADDWEWRLMQYPEFATRLGDSRYNTELTDMSMAAIEARQDYQHQLLAKLDGINREGLSDDDKLNYDLFRREVELEIEGEPYKDYLMPINQMGGAQIDLPSLPMITKFDEVKDYGDYLDRLALIPQHLDQLTLLMREGIKTGWVPPKEPLQSVAAQIDAQANTFATASPFYGPFHQFPEPFSDYDRQFLEESAEATIGEVVIPAFQKFSKFWADEYLPACSDDAGAWVLPADENYYAFRVRSYTTTDLTPDEIHEIGLSEVARIRAEMEQVIKDSGFTGRFVHFADFLRTDSRFYYDRTEDLLAGYREICDRIDQQLPLFFNTLPETPYNIQPIPDFEAPASTTAYYRRPASDGSRPGTFFANTYMLNTRPKWEMEALSIHEAVPGHHLQISLAMELGDLPNFRRFGSITAFVEGWGLYSESLGAAMGFYTTPYSKFGQLTYEMWRAVRLVIDTGIHDRKWTREQAITFFTENTAKTSHDIEVEVDRYIVWPGQALAYKIGELKIKQLRARAEADLGDLFDIRYFHDAVLLKGAVPLNILEQQIDTYIAEIKATVSDR